GELDEITFRKLLAEKIAGLNIVGAKSDVERFLVDSEAVAVWSRDFFSAVAQKLEIMASTK
ncbi:MAG: nucleotidyl transferase AbiEii/AbiGii toxin family protein, partial [Pseudomonadota bacterium]|nr:nucleotidyl transferase AbiEii/AbiGii toxin family protein [Pseudomonadota bacterium]